MRDRQDVLRQYTGDMLALERHILDTVKKQADDEDVRRYADALRAINRVRQTLEGHSESLRQHLATLGGQQSSIKEAVTSVASAAAALIGMSRSDKVSKMLRDDYTSLSLATMSYTMLHATGLALKHSLTADLALRHLRDLTPVMVELSQVIPGIVVQEFVDQGEAIDASVAAEAVRNTQEAWNPEVVRP